MSSFLKSFVHIGGAIAAAYVVYYRVKPFIPEALKIHLRKKLVSKKLPKYRRIWPIDERAGACPDGWTGWPEGKRFALVLTHDVETRVGLSKCVELARIENEMGFRSSFNFVAEDYAVPSILFDFLREEGFEIGLHGLSHDGNMFRSKRHFDKRVSRINRYLKDWKCAGFRAPSMYHDLSLTGHLDIHYDSSTFDTDPFEPQPEGVCTIFPFWVSGNSAGRGYVELPYTLPQDHTLFVLMAEKDITIWKEKVDWIVKHGGMVLLITHPDYMNCSNGNCKTEEYPIEFYQGLLRYIKMKYEGQYWHALPREMALFWKEKMVQGKGGCSDRNI